MAKVWLDVGNWMDEAARRPGATEEQCFRAALACDPTELQFCSFGTSGFQYLEAAAVRYALDIVGTLPSASAPAAAAREPARDLAAQVRGLIGQLPTPMQPPLMAFARGAKRLLTSSSAPPEAVSPPVPAVAANALGQPPFGTADVFLSFSADWRTETWRLLRDLRDGMGFRVLLPGGGVPTEDLERLEAWAQARATEGDGAGALRVAFVLAAQGRTSFEDRLQNLYMGVLREGDVCIDIGAHTGRHALPMSCAVGLGRVAAFEPNPAIAERLRARMKILATPNVTVHEVALSDEAGRAEFVIALERPEESGLKERVYNGPTRLEKVQVQLEKLDSMALGDPRFIKLDTEGAEYKVLLGARETIARARPVVAFEFGLQSYGAYGVDPNDVFTYFESLGYEIFSIHGDRLAQQEFVEASQVQSYWDYVACRREESGSVQAILRAFGH
ncbi:FkbM family methyltransferase [Ramlibacter sp. WS9]|uniref:FkbM family methyltransferase n=1 Tax=Ramlibacter sp. WS9 TaxID=1882741 RepID=UPI0011447E22|nr:FkbM family methyltransferase [Ramlibacter sp. WS9]ROZ71269.1 FkbM family methyltransferase [Ramlibacter sp. WS9]